MKNNPYKLKKPKCVAMSSYLDFNQILHPTPVFCIGTKCKYPCLQIIPSFSFFLIGKNSEKPKSSIIEEKGGRYPTTPKREKVEIKKKKSH